MGRFQFLTFLLISVLLLSVSIPEGCGRRIKVVRHYEKGHSFQPPVGNLWVGRAVEEIVLMDYEDPVANTNPKSGVPSPSTP